MNHKNKQQIILQVDKLVKEYDFSIKAVDGVSFNVRSGEIVGLLGPNGAGKTTIINMILGILEPTGGLIDILGNNANKNKGRALEPVNFAAVYAHLPGNLTVKENLRIFGLIYGVKNLRAKIESLLKEFDLEKFRDTKVGLLSSGEQTRANLAKAMLNSPQLLLLDEPTASLDPSAARYIREMIKNYSRKNQAGALLTSHNMSEVEDTCDRVLFLSHGKIILEGDPKTLPKEHKKKNLEELFITVAREPLSLEIE